MKATSPVDRTSHKPSQATTMKSASLFGRTNTSGFAITPQPLNGASPIALDTANIPATLEQSSSV